MGHQQAISCRRAGAALGMSVCAMLAVAQAPKRNVNWFQLQYWISFLKGPPENLAPPPYSTAVTSVSDTAGVLRAYFFVNTMSEAFESGLRTADHQVMDGNPSYDGSFTDLTHSAIFVPKPGDVQSAYLIAWNRIPLQGTQRFGWLELDLGADSAPPQVISAGYNWFMTGAACKRMVVAHANGEDYWFVAQLVGTNEFHAYQVTNEGLSPTPVVSFAGAVAPIDHTHGKLIPTVDGTRFVSVSETLGFTEPTVAPSIAEVHSFDSGTGIVAHQLTLDPLARLDGVEFSPSGRFLYATHWLYSNPVLTRELYQYDLEAADPNLSPVLMDSYLLGGLSGYTTNILSHAPNGRIYMSNYVQSLSVINEPDLPYPQCDYEYDGFLASGPPHCLPSFIKRYNDPPPVGPMVINGRITAAQAVVMPNPLCGTGELRWAGASGAVDLHWMDVQGRVLRYETRTAQGDRVMLDARGFAAGQYLLRVEPRNETPTVLRVSVAD